MLSRKAHFEQVPAAIARKIADQERKRVAPAAIPVSHLRVERARRRQALAIGRGE
jgi:hypothetical protein